MPNIKLRDGSGVETTYNNVDTITVPLADGTGTWKYSSGDFYNEDTFVIDDNYPSTNTAIAETFVKELTRQGANLSMPSYCNNLFSRVKDTTIDPSSINIYLGANANNQSLFNPYHLPKLPRFHGHFSSVDGQYPWRFLRASLSEINACLADVDMEVPSTGSYNLYNWYDGFVCCSDFPPKLLNYISRFNWSNTSNGYFNLKVGLLMKQGLHDLPVSSYASDRAQSWTINGLPWPTLTFETDNGVPKTAQWARKSIVFTGTSTGTSNLQKNYGICFMGYSEGAPTNTSSIWMSDSETFFNLIKDDSDYLPYYSSNTPTDLRAFFEENKDKLITAIGQPYLSSQGSTSDRVYTSSIDGTQQHYLVGYSKYNHTKAVETINSLPDCSEYCASKGYTNTISFNKYLGELTDGGAINNLTEQEIAVAVAKGWTVALTTLTA